MVVPAGRSGAITLASPAAGPDRKRGRADATLVEASITAHLLGLRLLTLDAKVALVPADVTVEAPRHRTPPEWAPALPGGNSHARAGGAAGRHRGLADAVRNLNEGERLLAEVHRRNGS